jgi:hypothetical protein
MSFIKRQIENKRFRSASRRTVGLPFELSLESISEVEKFQRSKDKESLQKFNTDVKEWADDSKRDLRVSIKSLVKRDVYLSDSLRANLYYDRKYASEVNRVGFSFVREGVYIHRGAGRGQGGVIGGRWIDRHGKQKERSADSAGLQGTGKRKPIRWFDPVIDRRLPVLADIVSDYSATMQIDAANIFIEQ